MALVLVLNPAVPFKTFSFCAVQCSVVQRSALQYTAVQCSVVQNSSAVQRSCAVQCSPFTLCTRRKSLWGKRVKTSCCQTPHITGSLHFTLYTVHCILYTVHFILYTLYSTPYNVYLTLYNVHFILYTVHCSLYTLY